MLRSINSKFYAVVFLLLLSFGLGYLVIAYFLHQQSSSSDQVQSAIELKTSTATLNEKFQSARLWEKVILHGAVPDAEKQFGISLQHIRSLLIELEEKEFNDKTRESFKNILKDVDQYESLIIQIIQLHTQKKLLTTRLLSTFQSISSMILQEQNPDLLRPLFGVSHYFMGYQNSKNLELYEALQIVVVSLNKKVKTVDSQESLLSSSLSNFLANLQEDLAVGQRFETTNKKLDAISGNLTSTIRETSKDIELYIKDILEGSEQNRQKLQNIFLASLFAGCLFLLFILRLLKNKIIGPVNSIAKVIARVQKGDMGARFTPRMKGEDEIVEMGTSFNNMLESIETRDKTLLEYQLQLEKQLDQLTKQKAKEERLTTQLLNAEKMEAVGALAGGVAHELNNTLSGVVTYPELLLMEMPEESPYRKPLTAIHESGVRAVTIVQDLLTLARRGATVRETINVNKLISNYLASPEGEKLVNDHPNITIDTVYQHDLLNIKGSKVHLLKTIMNLVTNGIEAIEGVGNITITTENRYVSQPIMGYDEVVEGEYVALLIQDSGRGIPREDLGRIFEPFFSKKAGGASGKGTGLGLAVVWGTVKDHRGYIDVESSDSLGTTFTIYCPVWRNETGEIILKQPIESLKGNGETILVVDDVEHQRDIARSMLEKLGYSVKTVASGEEAVSYLEEAKTDLVVLDMLMAPGIDGLETYRQIIAVHPQQKAIIASGYSETDRVLEAQRLGVAAYIRKPYSIERMGTSIKKALQGG